MVYVNRAYYPQFPEIPWTRQAADARPVAKVEVQCAGCKHCVSFSTKEEAERFMESSHWVVRDNGMPVCPVCGG